MASDDLYSIWLIVRRIVSLVIVFVGLYLGFMFIIGKDDARFQKYIAWVIIFALFVNFSYPITRTIIDFSNIISLNIYSSIVGPAALDPNTSITSQNTAGALIMNRLGLQGLVASAVNDQTTNANLLGSINSTPGALMALVFILYAAYIFLMLTAIIVMRLIALVVITVISPILLVDSVLPILGEKAKELRKIFFEQIIVGPVFMIMLALTLKFLTVFSTGSAGVAGLASGTGVSTITTFFNILMMTIMLHLMIKAVRKVSGDIGTYATNFAGTVGGFGVGKVMAGTGLLGRQTIGAAAQKVRDSKWVTQNPNNFFARRTYDLSNSLATNSFDMRNSKVVASKASAMGLSKGMGTGQKGGYLASQIARDKDIAARIERKDKDEDREIRYQEDVRSADGRSILHRKGTINDEALRLQNERYTKNRDSVFLTKKQNEALAESAIDKGSKMDIDNYQKLSGKEERATFIRNLKAELDELQKNDKNLSSAKAQSLVRSISDTEGLKKKEDEAFDLQVEDVMYKYEQMSEEKKANFLANQSKDVQRIVRGMIQAKQTAAAASATSTTQRASIPLATIPKATRINNETAQELTLETAQEATQRVASSSSLGNATLETAEQATSRVQGSAPLPTPIIPEDIKQVDIMHFDFRAAANDPSFKGTPSPVMAAKSELEPA